MQTGKLLVRCLHADTVSPINSQILESERDRMAIDRDWSRNIVPADCELIIVIVSAWVRYYPIQWHCSQQRPKATHHPEYCLKWAVFKVWTPGLDPADRKEETLQKKWINATRSRQVGKRTHTSLIRIIKRPMASNFYNFLICTSDCTWYEQSSHLFLTPTSKNKAFSFYRMLNGLIDWHCKLYVLRLSY